MLEITGFLKFSELDTYADGCQPHSGYDCHINLPVKAATVGELIGKLCGLFDVEADAIEINACGEDGRIDVQKMENSNGDTPSTLELAAWKAERVDLYAVTYTCLVETVERSINKL